MNKSELRKIYLAKRKNLSASERKRKSAQIAERFFARFDLSRTNFLHGFLPIEKFNEIDTKLIYERIWRKFSHVKTAAPRVDFQTNKIENIILKLETKLVENIWQISEPVGNDKIETEKIDTVLVPLLCFDRRGFRVGYGKGFYDRFLKECGNDCLKIGLSYFSSIEQISDARDFDVKLDFCVTPEEIVRFQTKKA